MIKNWIGILCAGMLVLFTQSAASSVITHGYLTTDDTTQVITDTSTGRLYSRSDAFDFRYLDTLAAVAPGGAWAGWSIATHDIADSFVAAALGATSTPCDGSVAYGTHCGTIAGWIDGDFGASIESDLDYIMYLSPPHMVQADRGISGISIMANGLVQDMEGSMSFTDYDSAQYRGVPASLLLYRDTAGVPEPTAIALFAAGLAGLGASRRKKSIPLAQL